MSYPNHKSSALSSFLFLSLCVNDLFEEFNLLRHKRLNHEGYAFIAKRTFAKQSLHNVQMLDFAQQQLRKKRDFIQ